MRLDQYLVEQKNFPSRARAQTAIKAGLVRVSGAVATKASIRIAADVRVDVDGDIHEYVSRGGVKLEAILRQFEINVAGKICVDLGASTGGFTEVLLNAGAAKIYAVDVGTGQLHPKIAGDKRVINLEKTHAKDLNRDLIVDPLDIIVCDVSFISLKKALPPALAFAAPGAQLAALIKPQFEVGRQGIGKGGIVKDGMAEPVAIDIENWINQLSGWKSTGYFESPIKGGDGNREFLVGAIKTA
ncbi:MAG: TlyA family RNA methyltransferase [Marinicaulis sp.]|nr:TlyA family RNA methyltransferase [Marinicaulis sp.]NNE41962.1 TlyA family RNA methyltransferase [Marinicaulis sp.]